MGLFSKPDPEKLQAKGDAEATQRFLHETFGLTRVPGAGYQVQDAVDMTPEVRDTASGLELVNGTRPLKRFSMVCVLPAQYTTCIVFGCKPPLTALTALSAADAAEMMSQLQQQSGCKLVELDSAWILTLG